MFCSIPKAVMLFLKSDFRRETRELLASSHGIRPRALMVYKVIAAAVFLRRLKLYDNSKKVFVHAHFLSTGLEIAILLKSIYAEFFIIGTAHGSDAFFQNTLKVSKLSSESDLIFAASCAVAARISECNEIATKGSSSKVIVRYCRVPIEMDMKAELKSRFITPQLRILTVARFHPQKGLEIALRTAKNLKDQNLLFHWTIIGDGKLRKKLERLIMIYDLGSHVTLLGIKTREFVQLVMEESDVLVLPSVRTSNSSDGLPVVILEAMSLGLYVISTPVGGIPEAIAEKRGSIVEADPSFLSNEIQRVWRRGESNAFHTHAAREWVELNCMRSNLDPLIVAYKKLTVIS
jgi:glycosyltransferase involved in cell wall biosynthesis